MKKLLSVFFIVSILFALVPVNSLAGITKDPTADLIGEADSTLSIRAEKSLENISVGDYLYLGTYLGERILWRCVDIDENGPLMISDKILCLKCYDAKGESPLHADGWGYIRKGAGSNCWYDSNLRQWLNSDEYVVSWSHCPPYSSSTQYGTNGYDDEPGFLCGFTEIELSSVATVTQKVYINEWELHRDGYHDGGSFEVFPGCPYYFTNIGNSFYEGGYYQNVTDRFFVPGANHLISLYRNLGDYLSAKPTKAATEACLSSYAQFDENTIYPYWSSTAVNEGASYENESMVGNTPAIYSSARAYNGEIGVRPAFYLSASPSCLSGNGSESSPYYLNVQIPSDAAEFNGHYYYCFDNHSTWSEAVAYCETLGGHMATISSEQENAFLFNYVRSQGFESAYFGLTDEVEEGTWVWVNGEDSSYRNWHHGEPNNSGNTEHYAMFYYTLTLEWNDGSFNAGNTPHDTTVFICEWDNGNECVDYHSWLYDIEDNCFVCGECGKQQEISPVLGYEFGKDSFSFSNEDVKSYDISIAGYHFMTPELKLDIASLLANGAVQLINYYTTGNRYGGSCFGIAAMNASFFAGMPSNDFGASSPSLLSIEHADSFPFNNDTRLKDAINIMFYSQSSAGFALFQELQDGSIWGDKNFYDVVEIAKSLKDGDYPPIVTFTMPAGGHAVNIIGIEPDGFFEDNYWISTYDSNNPNHPSFILVKKDYSEAFFQYLDDDYEWHRLRIDAINFFVQSPSFSIDYWAPDLRTSSLYGINKQREHKTCFESNASPLFIAEKENIEDNPIAFVVPVDNSLTITTPTGGTLTTDESGNYSTDIDSATVVPFFGTSLERIIIPYETGEYTVNCSQSCFININHNHNVATVFAENGCDIVYSDDGDLVYTPHVTDEYIEAAYYRYGILDDSDVIGVEIQGNASNSMSLKCESGDIVLSGDDIAAQSLFVQHEDYEMTKEALSAEFDDGDDSVVISSSDSGVTVTPGVGSILGAPTGDADGNGTVDTTDALYVLRCALHIAGDPEDFMPHCDMDGNGIIDTTDALLILRKALHVG